MACSDVTFSPFSQKNSTDFIFIWHICAKLMQEKVLKIWRRYRDAFWSYRESSRGGGVKFPPPPPSAARVKRLVHVASLGYPKCDRFQPYNQSDVFVGDKQANGCMCGYAEEPPR